MTKKEIVRSVAFVLVVCLLLLLLCEVFELSDTTYIPTRFKTFYDLNENTLDAVWIGTSGVDRYWVSSQAYEEYGMTVFPLSSDALPSWLLTYVVDEIYKTQNPKLLIVDLRAFCQTNTVSNRDKRARRLLDAMDAFSVNRLKAAFKTMSVINQVDEESTSLDLSYLLSYIKYHSKWSDKDFSIKNNISSKKCKYMGTFINKTLSTRAESQEPTVYNPNYYEELDPYTEEALIEFLDYIEEKDINVLFVNTPNHMRAKENGRMNTICHNYLKPRGIKYFNYSVTDRNGDFLYVPEMDHDADFYNRNHVNFYGAEKFTTVFSAYLDAKYDFEDHRNDEAVKEHWDGVYETVTTTIEKWEEAKKEAEEEAQQEAEQEAGQNTDQAVDQNGNQNADQNAGQNAGQDAGQADEQPSEQEIQ